VLEERSDEVRVLEVGGRRDKRSSRGGMDAVVGRKYVRRREEKITSSLRVELIKREILMRI
jgi:hypothetical protein